MNTTSNYHLALPRGVGAVVLLTVILTNTVTAQTKKSKLSSKEMTKIVEAQLAKRDGYQPGDLIHEGDVKRVMKALSAAGAKPKNSKQILEDTLPENDPLVRMLSTRKGATYMRKVKDYDLIYDRMDQVCRVSGGQRMLTDIIRLPDGDKLAKTKRPHGVPGFLDLLPKKSSGKVRKIKDYGDSTGRIYTEAMLIERLKEGYATPPTKKRR